MSKITNNSDSHFEFIKYGNEEKHLSKQEERRNYITPMILKQPGTLFERLPTS